MIGRVGALMLNIGLFPVGVWLLVALIGAEEVEPVVLNLSDYRAECATPTVPLFEYKWHLPECPDGFSKFKLEVPLYRGCKWVVIDCGRIVEE